MLYFAWRMNCLYRHQQWQRRERANSKAGTSRTGTRQPGISSKKIAPAVMARNLANAITDVRSLQPYNYHVEEALEKLIAAADAIIDEL